MHVSPYTTSNCQRISIFSWFNKYTPHNACASLVLSSFSLTRISWDKIVTVLPDSQTFSILWILLPSIVVLVFQIKFFLKLCFYGRTKNNKIIFGFWMYHPPSSLLQKCKVEAYGARKEFGTETCKPKLPFSFVPHGLLLYMSQQWRSRLVHSEYENYFILFSLSVEA